MSKTRQHFVTLSRLILMTVIVSNAVIPFPASARTVGAVNEKAEFSSQSIKGAVADLPANFPSRSTFQDGTLTPGVTETNEPSATPSPTITTAGTLSATEELPSPSATMVVSETLTPSTTPQGTQTGNKTSTPSTTQIVDETPTPSPTLVISPSPSATQTLTATPTPSVTPTTVGQPPELSFKLSAKPEQASPGEEVTFTISVLNNGSTTASGLSFSNTLPEYFTYTQNDKKEFNFDSKARLLTWRPSVAEAELPPGKSLNIEYSIRLTGKFDVIQIVDTATLKANNLEEDLVANTTLTALPSSKYRLTMLDTKGGEASGVVEHVKVKFPDKALKASSAIVIQDLSQQEELQAVAEGRPWSVFSLDIYIARSQQGEVLPPPASSTPAPQSQDLPTSTPESVESEQENAENLPNVEQASAMTVTPSSTPDPETTPTSILEQSLEEDRIIPMEAVESKFEQPVELTVSFDDLAELDTLNADLTPFLSTLDEESGNWIRVPLSSIDRETNTITAKVMHFSTWGAGIGSSFPQYGTSILLFDYARPDLFTGRSNYSIPIWTPSGRNGMAPSVALSYSSGTADGILGNVQAPWVGMGWNIDTVEIARKITSCTSCYPQTYGYENKFLLLFNGTGYELIPDGSISGRYHTKSESFLYVQRHNNLIDTPSAVNYSGEWWEVVETNGTRWRLGWNQDSEQLASMHGYPGAATGIWATLGYAGYAVNAVAYRWRADRVTDTHGNRMSLTYFEETTTDIDGFYYDNASYLDTISYTEHTSGSPASGYSVVFVRETRDYPNDYPWLTFPGDHYDRKRLDRIEVKYGANVIRTYDLGYNLRSISDDGTTWYVLTLSSIAISGTGSTAPTINFSYTDKDNRANCGSGCQEWAYPRLASISNGWGSTASYTYGNDSRPSTSWYNWRVETLDVADGVSASPMKTTYAYSTPCYNDSTYGWCNGSNIGELIGYGQTNVTTKDFNGTTTLATSVYKFYTNEQRAGREYELQNQNAAGTILSQTNTTYTVVTSGLPSGGFFTYASSMEEYLRTSSLVRVKKADYVYDSTTGNLTQAKEYDGTPTLYRQTDYEYVTNTSPSVWILDTVSRRILKDAGGTTLSKQEYGYDSNLPGVGSPTVGELTLSRGVDGSQTIDTKYVYDTYGNLTETRLYKAYGTTGSQPAGTYLTYSTGYDTSLKTYATSTTDPLTHTTSTGHDFGLGLPTSATDQNGNVTTTAYDGLGRVTQITYPGYGQPNVKYTYPTPPVSAPFSVKMEVWDESASTYRQAWQIMDGLGRVIQTQSPYETAGNLVISDVSYNAQGLSLNQGFSRMLTGTGGSYYTPSWGSIPHTTTNYDALGRITSITYPDTSQENFSYSGLRTTTIDRNNHQKVQENDSFRRLVKVEEYTGSGSYTLYATTTYEYDVRDLLKKVIDSASNQTTINYNGFGRKTSMSDPDMGSWSYGYNVLGNLTSQTDARNCVTTVTYDDLNRPLTKTYSGPGACATTPSVTYTYDSTTGGNEGIGRRTGMTDGSGSTTWFYNVLGQVTSETHNIDGTNYSVGSTFDAFSRPLTQTLPSGEALTYTYNAMGLLSGLSGTNTYVSQIHHNANGQVTDQQLGNGLLQQFCYEPNTLRLSNLYVYSGSLQWCPANPSNPRLQLSYTYQPNGNISQIVDKTRSETLDYTYDELDRLSSVDGPYEQDYSYDSIGNMTSKGVNDVSLNFTSVTSGFNHSCGLTSVGGVKCWGNNDFGQLGDGTTRSRFTPVAVSGLSSGVVAIEAGGFYTCALTASGGMKCWGENAYGMLGDGTTTTRTTPVNVSGLTSGVAAISAGYMNTCALTTGGGVKCWGYNGDGRVGDGTTVSPRLTPVDVSGLTNGVSAITAGIRHTCALTTGGGVKCWGTNPNGQLGDGTTTTRTTPVNVSGLTSGVVAISGGEIHTCALTTGGGVKCWGGNGDGQLGDGTTAQRLTPVNVSGLTSGAVSISVGNYHSCTRTMAGGMKCWGRNNVGQIGDGTTTQRLAPVNVSGLTSGLSVMAPGLTHSCASKNDGRILCWGENYTFGRLGDGTTVQRLTPTSVSGLTNGSRPIDAGAFHTCALTAAGGAECWGSNGSGQLGDSTFTQRTAPVDVSGLTSGVTAIEPGLAHTCALITSGGVKCWGGNGDGQLGDGTTSQRLTPVNVSGLTSGVVAIAVGMRHTCALTSSGGVKCWGQNAFGQLGDGTTTQRTTAVNVSGLTSGVIAISAGEQHTCALTSSGGVKCWGTNGNGQLGDGTTTQRLTPVNVSGLTSGITAIAAGNFQTCALTAGGGVKCWGHNHHGQLGDNTTTDRYTPVDVSGLTTGATAIDGGIDQTCAQTASGGMKCWGYNNSGRLGDGTITDRYTPVDVSGLTNGVIAVSTGFNHSCALTTDGEKCWGYNVDGELGDGTTVQRLTAVGVLSDTLASYTYGDTAHKHAVTALSTGESYTYDANGNMTQRVEGGVTYTQTFDAENRLVTVTVSGQTTQFVYDGDGNLVKKIKPDGSKTIYVSGVYEIDKTSGGVVTRTLTYYPVAGAMRIDGTMYYTLRDHLGSASVVTNSSGTVVGEHRYYPYGETRLTSGSMYTDKLFTSQREMAGLGLYHYGARFYEPYITQFSQPDSIIPDLYNPQALNRYSYALNNPVRYTDPTGHSVDCGIGDQYCSAGEYKPGALMQIYKHDKNKYRLSKEVDDYLRKNSDYDYHDDPYLGFDIGDNRNLKFKELRIQHWQDRLKESGVCESQYFCYDAAQDLFQHYDEHRYVRGPEAWDPTRINGPSVVLDVIGIPLGLVGVGRFKTSVDDILIRTGVFATSGSLASSVAEDDPNKMIMNLGGYVPVVGAFTNFTLLIWDLSEGIYEVPYTPPVNR